MNLKTVHKILDENDFVLQTVNWGECIFGESIESIVYSWNNIGSINNAYANDYFVTVQLCDVKNAMPKLITTAHKLQLPLLELNGAQDVEVAYVRFNVPENYLYHFPGTNDTRLVENKHGYYHRYFCHYESDCDMTQILISKTKTLKEFVNLYKNPNSMFIRMAKEIAVATHDVYTRFSQIFAEHNYEYFPSSPNEDYIEDGLFIGGFYNPVSCVIAKRIPYYIFMYNVVTKRISLWAHRTDRETQKIGYTDEPGFMDKIMKYIQKYDKIIKASIQTSFGISVIEPSPDMSPYLQVWVNECSHYPYQDRHNAIDEIFKNTDWSQIPKTDRFLSFVKQICYRFDLHPDHNLELSNLNQWIKEQENIK